MCFWSTTQIAWDAIGAIWPILVAVALLIAGGAAWMARMAVRVAHIEKSAIEAALDRQKIREDNSIRWDRMWVELKSMRRSLDRLVVLEEERSGKPSKTESTNL